MTIRFGNAPWRSAWRRRRLRWRCSSAKRSRARATIASSAGSPPNTGLSAAGTELLRRVAEGLGLRGGLLATFELLAVAVDPDHRHVHLQQRRDVGLISGPDVHPPLLAADPPGGLLEVRRVGLVAADLLGCDDEVELGAQ